MSDEACRWCGAVIEEAELLRRIRGDMSQYELAEASGVSRNVIANVETGRQKLYLHQLRAIVAVRARETGETNG